MGPRSLQRLERSVRAGGRVVTALVPGAIVWSSEMSSKSGETAMAHSHKQL